ncbi:MAG TPA: HNH endonuclease, partial [Candidatus Brevibacterium intestinigallinarum]|nr:HNH endonuclease [Candidatus Brevibacterium intestinigallinarum]
MDVFITTLDIRISLHQFMRRVSQFIATLTEKPVLAARASQGRRAWVEDLPGGQSILCAKGPTPLVHAHFNEGQALARALVKNQTESLDVTHVEKEPSEDESTGEDEAGTLDQSEDCSADASSASSTAPASANSGTAGSAANDGEGSAASLDEGVADDAFEDLPPLKSLSLDEQRMIQQLTFDTLITARPRTETVLEHATPGTEETDRYRVQVSLPDQATVLRKHATVVVTVPATTLLGLDNSPGMIADCPIPADMARTIAAGSTVWYRILTDPSTGRVLDHVAHKYEPDRATRMSVMSKWQTCTAPGCSRPARHCDIDHGIPFNHEHPEQGGRTEPLNLHPLCRRHH